VAAGELRVAAQTRIAEHDHRAHVKRRSAKELRAIASRLDETGASDDEIGIRRLNARLLASAAHLERLAVRDERDAGKLRRVARQAAAATPGRRLRRGPAERLTIPPLVRFSGARVSRLGEGSR
jgi:hypothetical protein